MLSHGAPSFSSRIRTEIPPQSLHLLVSDLHFGKSSRDEERAKEDALLGLFDSQRGAIDHVYLLGDVFDQFIEYRHLVPKGYVRFQSALAALTEIGVPVTYLVGNHDPWHLTYFEDELGVRVVGDAAEVHLAGLRIVLSHGDGAGRGRLSKILRTVTRHPLSMALYRTVLPADFGYRMARFVKSRIQSDEHPDSALVAGLQAAARAELARGADLVVYGHSHLSELHEFPEGTYVNTGSWHHERAVVALDEVHEGLDGTSTDRGQARQGCRIRQGTWNGDATIWYSDVVIAPYEHPERLATHNTDLSGSFG